MNDILLEISKFSQRNCLLNLLSTCKFFKSSDKIFFNKYFINQKIIEVVTIDFFLKIRFELDILLQIHLLYWCMHISHQNK